MSAYPTAGGIYWWASELGGAAWGWFTGWFNLVGLVAVVASVDYGCATFISALLNLWSVDLGVVNFADGASLGDVFIVFALVLALHALINIYSSHLVALFNNVSVWWHVAGVAVIIAILIFGPEDHQSASFVFTETINNSGFSQGMFWFYVLPLGFLLTQYTITGFDASAHISEETHGAEEAAPKGVWRSVFYSALIGWVLLLALTFAATDTDRDQRRRRRLARDPRQRAVGHRGRARDPHLLHRPALLRHGLRDERVAHDLRVLARPGDPGLADLDAAERTAARRSARCCSSSSRALIITLPALWNVEEGIPVAFFAVVSVCVIGLYIAYAIPIFLRWRIGDAFKAGPWTNGQKYRWMNLAATIWVGIITVIFCLPFTPAGVPWNDDFTWSSVNYAPLTVGGLILAVGIWWLVSARHSVHRPGPQHRVRRRGARRGHRRAGRARGPTPAARRERPHYSSPHLALPSPLIYSSLFSLPALPFTGPVRQIQFDEAAGIVSEEPTVTT